MWWKDSEFDILEMMVSVSCGFVGGVVGSMVGVAAEVLYTFGAWDPLLLCACSLLTALH